MLNKERFGVPENYFGDGKSIRNAIFKLALIYRLNENVCQYSFLLVGVFAADMTMVFFMTGFGAVLFVPSKASLPKIDLIRMSNNGTKCNPIAFY